MILVDGYSGAGVGAYSVAHNCPDTYPDPKSATDAVASPGPTSKEN